MVVDAERALPDIQTRMFTNEECRVPLSEGNATICNLTILPFRLDGNLTLEEIWAYPSGMISMQFNDDFVWQTHQHHHPMVLFWGHRLGFLEINESLSVKISIFQQEGVIVDEEIEVFISLVLDTGEYHDPLAQGNGEEPRWPSWSRIPHPRVSINMKVVPCS
jgi:hypothetical protein